MIEYPQENYTCIWILLIISCGFVAYMSVGKGKNHYGWAQEKKNHYGSENHRFCRFRALNAYLSSPTYFFRVLDRILDRLVVLGVSFTDVDLKMRGRRPKIGV